MKTKDLKNLGEADAPEPELSRREREALEAARRKADYDKRHAEGKTEAAKADLARLAEVKRRREEAMAKCIAEGRKPGWTADGLDEDSGSDSEIPPTNAAPKPKAAAAPPPQLTEAEQRKKAAAMEESTTSGEIPKLSTIEIKKLNADGLKDNLKARGLSTQGQKKDLIKRLTDYEAART